MKKSTLLALALFSLVMVGCAREDDQIDGKEENLESGPVALLEKEMSAKVVGNSLEVYFPLDNRGEASVTGTISVECEHLQEPFNALGKATFELGSGKSSVVVHIDQMPDLETISKQAEYVVNYRINVAGGQIRGSRSLFMLLEKLDLILLAPNKILEGQSGKLRAFVSDPRTGKPVSGKEVVLTLTGPDGKPVKLTADTDDMGAALFDFPGDSLGDFTVMAAIVQQGGTGEVEAQVSVVRESRLLLTTDKPMYQPGQTMYLRALALNRSDSKPVADGDTLFEIMDSKGNKVFKQQVKTNEFGVAFAEFTLATQVLMGPYSVKVSVGDVVSEKTVNVDRYSLPKFKVTVSLDKPWYMAGQKVLGEVKADYVFGKPVDGGTVKVTAYTYQAEWVPAKEFEGKTNASGLFVFNYQLPDYLIGQPIEGGKALIMLETSVTDPAAHEQKVAQNILITQNAMDIVLIPESGEIVPDVETIFYLFVTDPSGNPVGATCKLTVNGVELDDAEDEVTVPSTGPAEISIVPPHQDKLAIDISATDGGGTKATRHFDFSLGSSEAAILLRTDKAIYNVGDTMAISLFVTGGFEHVILDVVRKNQTVLTKTVDAPDGEGELLIDLDENLTQDLVVSAYFLADSGQFIRDTRMVFVQPANELTVGVNADKDEYLPGETATTLVEIKDADKKTVQAALGLQVLDEAVYALSEMKPGLLKLYFLLEEELATPSYQVGAGLGLSFGSLLTANEEAQPGSAEADGIQATTKAAFASLSEVPLDQAQLSSWADMLDEISTLLKPFYEARLTEIRDELSNVLAMRNAEYDQGCTVVAEYVADHTFVDFWGGAFTVVTSGEYWDCNVEVSSAGPDEVWPTEDDYSTKFSLWELSGEKWAGGGFPGMWDEDGAWADAGGQEPTNEEPPAENGGDGKEGVKVRKWFPETLYVNPSLITDKNGKATVEFPLADSITEWRLSTLASSGKGHIGSRTDGIIVFQDFFVDIDFPKYLTQNDELKFPIAIYNYLEESQTISIELEQDTWFELTGSDSQSVVLEPGEVSVVFFPVRVTQVGWHSLTVWGLGSSMSDAVQRTVEIKPDGKEIVQSFSARFETDDEGSGTDTVSQTIEFPDNTIEGSRSIVVKVLPGLTSHVVEGMDSPFALPGG